jgi:hypothetical protein
VDVLLTTESTDARTEGAPPYPGIPAIVGGSRAAARAVSRLAEVACVYPISGAIGARLAASPEGADR